MCIPIGGGVTPAGPSILAHYWHNEEQQACFLLNKRCLLHYHEVSEFSTLGCMQSIAGVAQG